MVRDKRAADVRVGDEILVQPGEVWTVKQEPVIGGSGVIVATDKGLLGGGRDSLARVVAEGAAE
jgi:hypothetical protein